MKSSPFQSFIQDQLEEIPGLRFRRMFSGFGIYSGEAFFGIIHKESLYFRTDERTKRRYEDVGTTFFTTRGSKKALKKYYEVPPAVIEDKRELTDWAREAVETVGGSELIGAPDLPPRPRRRAAR